MAQHQGLKRKGGADPDHQMSRNHAPPPLSIEVPKMRDLPDKSNPWSDVQLPVDILLLTVEDCEFLACYAFLKNSFKSYDQNLGFVYFGTMGETGEEALKVALMKCYKGSSGPGGSQNVIKNAVMKLRPKAAFLVGSCQGINPECTKRGDVVVSSKLSTEQFTTPVRRNIGNLILFSAGGWNPPLKDPVGEETVQVHRDSDIFSGSQFITKQRRMSQSRVIAVETEGEGLFAAAHDMNIIKGISHFSDDSNAPDESWKSFASIMAASLVFNMLNDPVVFKEWPHYEDLTAKNQPDKQMPDSVCLEECQKQLRSLYETSSKVRIIPWDQNSAVDIDKIYTDLSWVMDDRTPRGVIQEELDHYTEIFAHREPRRAPKRILVYGQPGIGKTVFTKKATFDWSQQRYSETLGAFDLVLLVRLRDVSNLQDVPSILRASEVLDSNGAISVDNLYDYICRHQEKVLLVLDGYDEYVYCSKNESPVFKIWKKSQLRDCCVVITSREMKAETLRNCSDAQFKIDGFNDARQEEFARRFLKDDKDIQEFFMYLWQHNLSELAQIPLLLLMLCLLWTKTTREELPKERADIFAQFMTTMFDHMCEKKSAEESVSAKDYSDELYALGRLAFEALLQGQLYFPVSQLPAGYSLIERLIEVGLFQVLNMASLNREKGVYFIHKSVQEYLAGNFLREELTSKKAEGTNSLSKVDSVEKIFKINEALKFPVELSEEAARDILIQLGMAAKKEELTEFKFDNETPSQNDLSEEQRDFINLCNQLFFYCSAETRKNLFPTFLFSLGGVLVINEKQLNVIVQEKLVQTTEKTPNYVFFNESYTEPDDYSNLIILTQQLNAVIVSSVGEKKASEFLSNLTWRRIDVFFLKKEENNTHLYLDKIVKDEDEDIPFPCDIIKALISKQETTKKTNMNGDESSEESSSSCCSKRHGLSRVWRIEAWFVNRSEVELMNQMMAFITAPHEIEVWGEDGEVFDAEVTESLLRSIQVTHKLKELTLWDINVTSSPAVEFINNVFKKAPNLEWLNMSWNPLPGAGVDSLIKHLSCAPHLKTLSLRGVKMTPQQVMDLSSAIKQHSNITHLNSSYHDDYGNPKPEHEWPSEDFWKKQHPWLFSHSSNESQTQKQQIPAETPLSIHDSLFPVDDQDTVGRTFSAPPDPTAEPMLTEASIPTAHGSSHGLVPQVQYSEHFSLPDIHTHHHSAPSTIFTPRESLSTDLYLISGPGPSTVTQDEPIDEELNLPSSSSKAYDEQVALQEESPGRLKQKAGKKRKVQEMITEVDPLLAELSIPTAHGSNHGLTPAAPFSVNPLHNVQYPQNYSSPDMYTYDHSAPSTSSTPGGSLGIDSYLFRGSGLSTVTQVEPERNTRLNTQDVPSHDPGTAGPVPVPLHSAGAPIPTSHFSSHSVAPFSEHPLRHRVLESPLQAWQPRSTFPGYSYPRSSGISTDGLTPPVHSGYLPLRGMQDPPQQRVQPQNTTPCDLNLEGSAVSYPQEIPGFLSPHGMQGARLHGLQPQSTMSDDPYLIAPGVSTHTHSTVNLESLLPHGTLRSPQYGFHPQIASPSYPHLQFSGSVTSSITHPPIIPGYSYPCGNRMRAPQQATQPQSASSGHLHISGPVTSSVTHPPVIPGYFYPYGNPMRAPLQTTQPQSTSSGDPYLSGPMSSVIHRPVIPEYSSYPYGNYMRAPPLAPQLQSASPGDPHLSGPMSSVMHPSVIPEFLSPRGILSSPPSGTQRGSPEVQHERNPSTESGTRPSY